MNNHKNKMNKKSKNRQKHNSNDNNAATNNDNNQIVKEEQSTTSSLPSHPESPTKSSNKNTFEQAQALTNLEGNTNSPTNASVLIENEGKPSTDLQTNASDKKVNSVVVSVKSFATTNEVDEVTKLFRKMIGIDKADTTSTIVRQFSCQTCYRAWWKRVRVRKQVSMCSRCKKKYDPIPLNREFGIAEFRCQYCSHEFYHWSSKDTVSTCKKCNNKNCLPIKILPQTNTNKKVSEIRHNTIKNGSQCSSSNSSSSGQGFSNVACQNNIANANNSSDGYIVYENNIPHSNNIYAYSNYYTRPNTSNYYNRYKNNYRNYYSQSYGFNSNFYCEQCNDTNINLNSKIIFRPKTESVHDYMSHTKYGTSFCSNCRRIPTFSENHVSTGSTLGSLSYQDDLELRFLDDEIDLMEPCSEEREDEPNGDEPITLNKELDKEGEAMGQLVERSNPN